jgi:acyl carrier protein
VRCAFVGNVEGRDLLGDIADVVVTDGFTGNVALKSMEGAVKALVKALARGVRLDPRDAAAADTLLPVLLPMYATFSPETYGGAMLLGVDGVCVISHGSSSATPSSTPCVWRPRWSRPTSWPTSRRPSARPDLSGAPAGPPRSGSAGYTPAVPAPRGGLPLPAETHVEQGPLDRQAVLELVRDRLADILEIEPGSIEEGHSFRDDLDADSLALIELVEAIEEELGERSIGFRIEDDDLEDLRTVRDAVDYVVSRLG